MKDDIFHFKQFSVRHNNRGLKVNTDAVLLGALADSSSPNSILDIGTGTGVIALMLAQRFLQAKIDALEPEKNSAKTADENFRASVFHNRINTIALSFQNYFTGNPNAMYDMIVSNPPFFLNSLKPDRKEHEQAKHTGYVFFEELFSLVKNHLNESGSFWLILPPETYRQIQKIIFKNGWHGAHFIHVFSKAEKPEFRLIVKLVKQKRAKTSEKVFYIRNSEDKYHDHYKSLLKNFLTIF